MTDLTSIKKNGKIIGYVENGTFFSKRKPIHFMRIYQGFGISEDIIEELKNLNVKAVIFIYYGSKKILYKVDLEKYIVSTKTFTFDGDDLQRFVSVRDMDSQTETEEEK